jgi:tRNA A37 threonylcarbamoyladenosine dehydratase
MNLHLPILEDKYRLHRRFDRMGRLVGDRGMHQLFDAHVMVVGVGGVGSFAAESLVRSGVGRLSIVDFDLICVTNANRQLHTLRGTVGEPKVEVMAERLRLVNPQAQITAVREFYNSQNSEELLSSQPDMVVDAIDNVTAKCHLLATCRAAGLPVVCSTGAAARMDPTQIEVADLAETRIDPLAKAVRRILREQYDFPAIDDGLFGIEAVFSREQPIAPSELLYDMGEGFRCVCPQGQNGLHECEKRNRIDGTAGYVTGAFGLTCASVVVRRLLAQ